MKTLTIQVTNNGLKAVRSLEAKHLVKIVNDPNLNSPALPGTALSLEAFRNWISVAEHMPTISLQEAKASWNIQKKKLKRLSG
jgi:hypothetical protein